MSLEFFGYLLSSSACSLTSRTQTNCPLEGQFFSSLNNSQVMIFFVQNMETSECIRPTPVMPMAFLDFYWEHFTFIGIFCIWLLSLHVFYSLLKLLHTVFDICSTKLDCLIVLIAGLCRWAVLSLIRGWFFVFVLWCLKHF